MSKKIKRELRQVKQPQKYGKVRERKELQKILQLLNYGKAVAMISY